MKKLIALLLAVAMTLSLAACGSAQPQSTKLESGEVITEGPATTTSEETTVPPTSMDSPTDYSYSIDLTGITTLEELEARIEEHLAANIASLNSQWEELAAEIDTYEKYKDKSTRHFPACSHNFPKAGEARFQGLSRLFRLLGKFPYLGESRRILMAVSSKTSSKTRFYYAATRRISSAAVQPSIWA